MLNELVQNRLNLGNLSTQEFSVQTTPLGEKILAPLILWFKENCKEALTNDDGLYNSLLQTLKSCSCESKDTILSRDLLGLAMGYRHHPLLSELARQLFNLIVNSDLPDSDEAKRQLNILDGHGGLGDHVVSALDQLSYHQNVIPLACAMGVAGLAGRAVRVGLSGALDKLSWARSLGTLGSHALGGISRISSEALAFPGANILGYGLVGMSAPGTSYWGEVGHGFKLMGTLNGASFVSTWGFRALHGAQQLDLAVRRFRRLAQFNKLAMPVGAELTGLSLLNYNETPGRSFAFYLSQSLVTMAECRLANGVSHAIAPGLHHRFQLLDTKAYQLVSQGMARSLSSARNQVQAFFKQGNIVSPYGLRHAPQTSAISLINLKISETEISFDAYDVRSLHVALAVDRKGGASSKQQPPQIVQAQAPRGPVVKNLSALPKLPQLKKLEISAEEPFHALADAHEVGNPRVNYVQTATPLGPLIAFTTPGKTQRPGTNADAVVFGLSSEGLFAAALDGVGSNSSGASGSAAIALGESMAAGKALGPSFTQAHKATKRGATTAAAWAINSVPNPGGFYQGKAANAGDTRLVIFRPTPGGMAIVFQNFPHSEWAKPLSDPTLARDLDSHAAQVGRPGEVDNPLVLLHYTPSHGIFRALGKHGKEAVSNHKPDIEPIEVQEGDVLLLYTDSFEGPLERMVSLIQGKPVTEAAATLHQHQLALQWERFEAYQRYNQRLVNLIYPDPQDRRRALLPIQEGYPFYYEMRNLIGMRGEGLMLTGSIFQKTESSFRLVDYHNPDHLTGVLLLVDPQNKLGGIIPSIPVTNPWPSGIEIW